jgi:hypothetical protein
VHADFKPRNIVRINGDCKLIDFDAAAKVATRPIILVILIPCLNPNRNRLFAPSSHLASIFTLTATLIRLAKRLASRRALRSCRRSWPQSCFAPPSPWPISRQHKI